MATTAIGTRFQPVACDPAGRIERYAPLCTQILTRSTARRIVGCITSWSRKEIIPALEKHGGLLWYAAPYEGFETNDHVVYMIIADESVSALDVSVQKRVLELLKELQDAFGIAYLFISHDMAVVENISDRVAVMSLGQIVETGTRAQVFGHPRHSYTRRLIEAVPVADPARRRAAFPRLVGDIPSAVRRPNDPPARLVLGDVGDGHLVAAE